MARPRISLASASPSRGASGLRFLARQFVWPLLGLGLWFTPVGAVTAVVPDDFPTVQLGIDSGADTVLVREGTYVEVPVVERNLVLCGIGVSRRPRLNGLQLTNRYTHIAGTFVSGFDVSGTVGYAQVRSSSIGISFSDCSMDGGIQTNAYNYNCGLSLVRCRLASGSSGDLYSGKGVGSITMEADTLDGGVSWIVWSRSSVSIQHCWFRGVLPGSLTVPAIQLLYEPDGPVSHNRIENYGIGISATDVEGPLTLEGNTISGCGTGMQLSGDMGFVLTGNDIRNCNTGVSVSGSDPLRLVDNTIIGASNDGVVAYPWSSFDAERNMIGNCGGDGFHVEWDPWAYSGLLRNNTVFNCAGSAMELSWAPAVPYYGVSVENNIGFDNGAWGLSVSGTQIGHGCNNWFGNHSGAVSGVAPVATDLSVDPMFCDVTGADVRLNSASPLLDTAGCGQIGALGVGCGATPTLVQRFTASRVSEGVRVVWEIAAGATASAVWVERAESEVGGWARPVTVRSLENSGVVELDRSAATDRTYWYRLVAQEGSATEVIGAPIEVRAGARLGFGLTAVGPSPGSGPVRIGFTLPRTADIQISVFDVQGRRVATLASGVWPAGAHEVEWNGRTGGAPAPAGLYVLHYRYPGGIDRRAVARVR